MTARQALTIKRMRRAIRAYELAELHQMAKLLNSQSLLRIVDHLI